MELNSSKASRLFLSLTFTLFCNKTLVLLRNIPLEHFKGNYYPFLNGSILFRFPRIWRMSDIEDLIWIWRISVYKRDVCSKDVYTLFLLHNTISHHLYWDHSVYILFYIWVSYKYKRTNFSLEHYFILLQTRVKQNTVYHREKDGFYNLKAIILTYTQDRF